MSQITATHFDYSHSPTGVRATKNVEIAGTAITIGFPLPAKDAPKLLQNLIYPDRQKQAKRYHGAKTAHFDLAEEYIAYLSRGHRDITANAWLMKSQAQMPFVGDLDPATTQKRHLEDVRAKHFHPEAVRPSRAERFMESTTGTVVQGGLKFAAATAAVYVGTQTAGYLTKTDKEKVKHITQGLAAVAAAVPMIAQQTFKSTFETSLLNAYSIFKKSGFNADKIIDIVDEIKADCREILEAVAPRVREDAMRIYSHVQESATTIASGKTPAKSPRTVEECFEYLEACQTKLLAQPRNFNDTLFEGDFVGRNRQTTQTINDLPAAVRSDVEQASNSIDFASGTKGKGLAFYIQGAPGTGKTSLMNLLARSKGAHISWVNWGNPGSLKDDLMKDHVESGQRNRFIVIDELHGRKAHDHAEQQKLNYLNGVLNRDGPDGMGEQSLNNVTIFGLGYLPPTDVSSKFTSIIQLPPLDRDQLKAAMFNTFFSEIETLENTLKDKKNNKAVDRDIPDMIDNAINDTIRHIPPILDFILDKNKDHGARSVQHATTQTTRYLFKKFNVPIEDHVDVRVNSETLKQVATKALAEARAEQIKRAQALGFSVATSAENNETKKQQPASS